MRPEAREATDLALWPEEERAEAEVLAFRPEEEREEESVARLADRCVARETKRLGIVKVSKKKEKERIEGS